MMRLTFVPLLAFALAAPAAGYILARGHSAAAICFDAGTAAYRISPAGAADLVVRVAENPQHPDLTMQIVDDPLAADFVLVDDDASACPATARRLHIAADHEPAQLTVGLSRAPAEYKTYVNSARFSQSQAAAIFAAEWKAGRGRIASAR
jgi:hypothetical protein